MRELLSGLWALDPYALAAYAAIMCGLGGLLAYCILMELLDSAAEKRHRKVSDARRMRRGAQQPAATVARMAQPTMAPVGPVARDSVRKVKLRNTYRS